MSIIEAYARMIDARRWPWRVVSNINRPAQTTPRSRWGFELYHASRTAQRALLNRLMG